MTEELEIITERDESLRIQLNRRERLVELVTKNRVWMESAIRSLDDNLNKKERTLSPSYQQRHKKDK